MLSNYQKYHKIYRTVKVSILCSYYSTSAGAKSGRLPKSFRTEPSAMLPRSLLETSGSDGSTSAKIGALLGFWWSSSKVIRKRMKKALDGLGLGPHSGAKTSFQCSMQTGTMCQSNKIKKRPIQHLIHHSTTFIDPLAWSSPHGFHTVSSHDSHGAPVSSWSSSPN